jgi:6-pyruvoyltetrahydropterin/6-carboxytetrahydropterin synthase
MFRICKEFHFSASHNIETLPEGHQCRRVHGHNYVVMLELAGETVDEHGFLIDFRELNQLRDYIDENLDHRHLNDVLDFSPSTENLAYHFYTWCKARWPETCAVRVQETPKLWAEYRP